VSTRRRVLSLIGTVPRGVAPVIFGEPGDAVLLGAVTLESLGFVLDAVRRHLLPLPMVVAGSPRA
jgi:hypothetical protein